MADISASLVKELRQKTGVGIMQCKKALVEADGDMEKATEILRKEGMSVAEQKSGRATNEGIIASYVHAGDKLGVLVELTCETDFSARTGEFKALGKDIAMQVAASAPKYVTRDAVPPEAVEKELEIYKEQASRSGKPEKVWERIAQGKLEKWYSQVCLMEQVFIRDTDKTVEDVIKEFIGKIKENVAVRRFVRMELGEDAD